MKKQQPLPPQPQSLPRRVEIALLHAKPAQKLAQLLLLLFVQGVIQLLKTENFLQPILNVDVKLAFFKILLKEYVELAYLVASPAVVLLFV